MHKYKEFKTPTNEPVRCISDDLNMIDWIYPTWTNTPEPLWKSAYSQGCISKDIAMIGADPEHAIAAMKAKEVAYEARLKEVMIELIEEGEPENLDAQGRPKVSVLGDIVGNIPTAYLRNRLFAEITNDR